MLTRRSFVGSFATLAAGSSALAHAAMLDELARTPGDPVDIARDESFWFPVQQAFTVDRSFINLNNGGVSPSPAVVQEAMRRHEEFSNTSPPPHSLWAELEPQREVVRERLAKQWGVSAEEVALTRNSSESLQTCQLGFDLKPGDEVLTTTVDYPRMITTFKQRERRDGIVLKQFKMPIPCEDKATIVRLFEENITPRTRLILMSHIVNITGQILPVHDVVAMARTKNGGIPVIVDGAHAFAHFDFKLSGLGCDYYGVSLHKWLTAPHGTGLLYVRRDKIKNLWPIMAADTKLDDDIRKFEEIGTHPAAPYLAIAEALTFHQGIGGPRKEARLRYLRDYWAKRFVGRDRVRLHTSLKPEFSCCIATVQLEGIDSRKLNEWLLHPKAKHRILTAAIKHDEFEGIRVTPNVYTTLDELDCFCDALEHALKNGIPASYEE
ncbi:MAG: aminotransferase class V-fold PLP-dependent enzyme [Phycisphaerales bacterium]